MATKGKWHYVILGLLVSIGLVAAGCGKTSSKDEQVKITFWEWWTDQQSLFENLAKEYEAETGVKVVFELSAPVGADYFNKIQAAAQANMLPDVIGLAGGGEFLARYINADRIYELTAALKGYDEKWKNSFFPRALEAFYYEPQNAYQVKENSFWGVPISVMNIQVFYNKDLFRQAGLDPEKTPKTWGEWMEMGKALRAAGIPPLIVGLGDLWIDYTLFNAYSWSYLGKENMRLLYKGELPYTNEACVKTMKLFSNLKENDFLYPGTLSMANKEAEINFANQKAAMMINGSWAVNVYHDLNPSLNLGVFPFPKPDDAEHPMYLIGGVGKGCAVTTKSRYPGEAIEFLKWFTAKEQQIRLAKESREIPANMQAMGELDPLLRGFAEGMNQLTPDLKIEEVNEVREVISKGIQSILVGESYPQEILKNVWETKQKIVNKKNSAN